MTFSPWTDSHILKGALFTMKITSLCFFRAFIFLPAIAVLTFSFLSSPAPAEQFNTSDGSNYGSTDSAFKLYWDNATDTLKIYSAASGTAGNPITWIEGLTMDTGGASLFQVANDAGACAAAKLGRIRYNGTATWEYCNGTAWTSFGSGATTIDELTDAYTDYATNHNIIMGRASAAALTAGAQYNLFIGDNAGATTANSTSTTDVNIAIGYDTLSALTSGSENVAIGAGALASNTTGRGNIAIGPSFSSNSALQANTTGNWNIAIGDVALGANTTGVNNIAIGSGALSTNSTATANIAVGTSALRLNTSGFANNAFGGTSLESNTTGDNNVAVGDTAMQNNTTGYKNTGLGANTLHTNVAKRESVAVGYDAMNYADNTATGAVTYNTAVGAYALKGSATPANNTGTNNTALGHSALTAVTSGGSNVAVGALAGDSITTGGSNILIGYNIDTPAATTSNHLNIGNTIYGDLSTGNVGIGTATPQSALHVPDGKYAQFEDNNAGAPPAADCDNAAERGRLSIDTTNNRLYVCNGATRGWDYVALTD